MIGDPFLNLMLLGMTAGIPVAVALSLAIIMVLGVFRRMSK